MAPYKIEKIWLLNYDFSTEFNSVKSTLYSYFVCLYPLGLKRRRKKHRFQIPNAYSIAELITACTVEILKIILFHLSFDKHI